MTKKDKLYFYCFVTDKYHKEGVKAEDIIKSLSEYKYEKDIILMCPICIKKSNGLKNNLDLTGRIIGRDLVELGLSHFFPDDKELDYVRSRLKVGEEYRESLEKSKKSKK